MFEQKQLLPNQSCLLFTTNNFLNLPQNKVLISAKVPVLPHLYDKKA